MPNFGTYEGHRLLSSAMANTVNSVTKGYESKIQQEQWEKEHAEQKLNNDIARRRAEAQFASQERENKAAIAQENIIRNMFSAKSGEDLFTNTDSPLLNSLKEQSGINSAADFEALNPIARKELSDKFGLTPDAFLSAYNEGDKMNLNPNYEDIIKGWTKKHSYADYLAQSGEGWSGSDLTYDNLAFLNTASTDMAKTNLVNFQKSMSHLSEKEYNEFFKNNEGLSDAMSDYLLEIGQKKSPDDTWFETMNPDLSGSGEPDLVDTAGWYTPDNYDRNDFMRVDKKGTTGGGGDTFFKSSTANPSKDDVKNKKILLDAIKQMRFSQTGEWDEFDNMWLHHDQGQDHWMLEENDMGHNDSHQVRVNESGVAQVFYDGRWRDMNSSSGMDAWGD